MKHEHLTYQESAEVYKDLLSQCHGIKWIENALIQAWTSFDLDGWNYDGATFVAEVNDNYWEAAAFIHDWLNCTGYVGKQPDLYFIKIMVALGYGENKIFERAKWMQWTFINKWSHVIKGTFIADDLPKNLKEHA